VFALFDSEFRGKVEKADLPVLLKTVFKIVPSKRETILLGRRLSNDRIIRFQDICELVTPKYPSPKIKELLKVKFETDKRRQRDESLEEPMDDRVVRLMGELIESVIQAEMDLEMLRFRFRALENETGRDILNELFKSMSLGARTVSSEKVRMMKCLCSLVERICIFETAERG